MCVLSRNMQPKMELFADLWYRWAMPYNILSSIRCLLAYDKVTHIIKFTNFIINVSFCRYDCSIDKIVKGEAIIFPGELTHTYTSQPISDGNFSFLTLKMDFGNHLMDEIYGLPVIPGFDKIANWMKKFHKFVKNCWLSCQIP